MARGGQLSCRDTACRGGQQAGVRAGWHGGLGTSVRRGGHGGSEDARSGHTARRRPGWVPPGKHIRLPTPYPRTRLVITGMPFTRSTENHQALKWCGGQAMLPSESGPLAQSGHRVHSLTFRPAQHGTNVHSHKQSRLVTNTSWPHCPQQCAVNQTTSARLCLSTGIISHTCCVTPPIYHTVY